MCEKFATIPVSLDFSPTDGLLAIGFIDGGVRLFKHRLPRSDRKSLLAEHWHKRHKRAVRRVRFGTSKELYTVTSNRALCLWDVETGKKQRCLRRAHDSAPYALCVFRRSQRQFLASGDEDGVVRFWDLRAEQPQICEFHEHEDYVSDLLSVDDGRRVLSTSVDSTLVCYDFAARKTELQSEPLFSSLNCLALANDTRVVCGGDDGYLEIFKHGEYGNILERTKSDHEGSVDEVVPVGAQVVATGSSLDGSIRLTHLQPHHPLCLVGSHEDGVEEMGLCPDGDWLWSVGDDCCLRVWDVGKVLKQLPSLEGGAGKKSRQLKKVSLQTPASDNIFEDLLNEGVGKAGSPGPDESHSDSD